MQIKRLLDDRDVLVGDRFFDAQRRFYALVEYSGDDLVVTAADDRPTRFKPDELGCYLVHVNRTERGLAKERLRGYWENQLQYNVTKLIVGIFNGIVHIYLINNYILQLFILSFQ